MVRRTPLILNQAAVPAAGWRLVLVQPRAAVLAGFSTTFKARYEDEIGDLGRAFNRMAGRLDEL